MRDVPPGTYDVAVWNPDRKPTAAQRVTVKADKTSHVRFKLTDKRNQPEYASEASVQDANALNRLRLCHHFDSLPTQRTD